MNADSIATLASCAKYDGGKSMNVWVIAIVYDNKSKIFMTTMAADDEDGALDLADRHFENSGLGSQYDMIQAIKVTGVRKMNGFLKAIRDAFTDPNSYICLTKVAGVVLLICGLVGYFLGKDPTFLVITGLSSLGVGKALDATVKPETPEQAAK